MSVRYITYIFLITSIFTFWRPTLRPVYAASSNLSIITNVINDNGNTWNPSDLSISVKKGGRHVSGSPAPGVGSPGTQYSLEAGVYTIMSGPYEKYSSSYGGDCGANGQITLLSGEEKTCIITENDLAPNNVLSTPLFPNTGNSSNTDPIFCLNRNHFTWIIAAIIFGFVAFRLYPPKSQKKKQIAP